MAQNPISSITRTGREQRIDDNFTELYTTVTGLPALIEAASAAAAGAAAAAAGASAAAASASAAAAAASAAITVINAKPAITGTGQLVIDSLVVDSPSSGGLGYTTGAGGTQTQNVSKVTATQLNTPAGRVTMANSTVTADTTVSFSLNNSRVAPADVMVINHHSGGTIGGYTFNAACATASATISLRNITAGNLAEAVVFQFVVIKGSTS